MESKIKDVLKTLNNTSAEYKNLTSILSDLQGIKNITVVSRKLNNAASKLIQDGDNS